MKQRLTLVVVGFLGGEVLGLVLPLLELRQGVDADLGLAFGDLPRKRRENSVVTDNGRQPYLNDD
jgi:hypothetical protein